VQFLGRIADFVFLFSRSILSVYGGGGGGLLSFPRRARTSTVRTTQLAGRAASPGPGDEVPAAGTIYNNNNSMIYYDIHAET